MSQSDYTIADQDGASFLVDINNQLAAIVSNNSGATEPTTTYAYQWWADTSSDTLKQRNAANSAWINILTLSTGVVLIQDGAVTTAKIANDAVTYAKMQNVSATSRILGRKTAAAGDTEECTLSEILDFIGSAAQGDILYRDASGWARLGSGTSGQFLKTQGAGANPAWDSAGGITLLGTLTTTSGTTQTLSSLDLTPYKYIYGVVSGVSFTTAVAMTTNGNQMSFALAAAGDALYGLFTIDLTSAIGSSNIQSFAGGTFNSSSGIAGVRVFNTGLSTASTSISFAGGTFDNGTIKLYGGR